MLSSAGTTTEERIARGAAPCGTDLRAASRDERVLGELRRLRIWAENTSREITVIEGELIELRSAVSELKQPAPSMGVFIGPMHRTPRHVAGLGERETVRAALIDDALAVRLDALRAGGLYSSHDEAHALLIAICDRIEDVLTIESFDEGAKRGNT
jgi:hypothetical protein